MMAAATLDARGVTDREIFLCDAFARMTEPEAADIRYVDEDAREAWRQRKRDDYNARSYGPLDKVQANLDHAGFPGGRIYHVEGPVEEAISGPVPDAVAGPRSNQAGRVALMPTLPTA